MDMNEYMVHVHGKCYPNPGKGGWCARLYYGDKKMTLAGGLELTTSIRVELYAIKAALEKILEIKGREQPNVTIYTCQNYIFNALRHCSRGGPIYDDASINADMFNKIFALVRQMKVQVCFVRSDEEKYIHEESKFISQFALECPEVYSDEGYLARLTRIGVPA